MPVTVAIPSAHWHPYTGQHRCSMPRCYRDAVAVHTNLVTSGQLQGRTWHRYLCRDHLHDRGLTIRHYTNRVVIVLHEPRTMTEQTEIRARFRSLAATQ